MYVLVLCVYLCLCVSMLTSWKKSCFRIFVLMCCVMFCSSDCLSCHAYNTPSLPLFPSPSPSRETAGVQGSIAGGPDQTKGLTSGDFPERCPPPGTAHVYLQGQGSRDCRKVNKENRVFVATTHGHSVCVCTL